MNRNHSGLWGEIFAQRYLRDRNIRILNTNFTCRFGELDIVADNGKEILIVEVKTRRLDTAIRPMEAVDEHKQRRMTSAAQLMLKFVDDKRPLRFDVAEVYLNEDDTLHHINYIENAF